MLLLGASSTRLESWHLRRAVFWESVFFLPGKIMLECSLAWDFSRWYMGGRAKPGESPQQAAARVMRRELCIQLPQARFEAGCMFYPENTPVN